MALAIPRRHKARNALVAGFIAAQGCAAWKPAAVAPSTLDGKPREVRVTLRNGQRFPVSFPYVASDTLRGIMVGTPEEPVVLALGDIAAIDLPRTDTSITINLVAVGIGLALAVYGCIYIATHSST